MDEFRSPLTEQIDRDASIEAKARRKKQKKQKHEEIRKIALRMYTQAAWPDYEKRETCFPKLEDIWKLAEDFYKFAKEKENDTL